jgi:uroporphyrinogen decarboxylase
MENSRERVFKALNHTQPETVPVHIMGFDKIERWLNHFQANDYIELREKLDLDLQEARPVYAKKDQPEGTDIWGVVDNSGGSEGFGYSSVREGFPLSGLSSVREIEKIPWPDPDDFDFDVVAEVFRSLPTDTVKVIKAQWANKIEGKEHIEASRSGGSGWLPILCAVFHLVGLEEAMIKLALEPELIEAMIARLEEFIYEFSKRLIEATKGIADIYWYGDDFASQRGIMISPELWRRYLKPTYKRLFDLAKSYGLKVWFHSCGTFREVLPDLIDIGMDVWETVQVHLPGNEPEVLKREYGKDIAFYGAINSQKTLPSGTPEEVRTEVRKRIRVLGKEGGYICGSDHSILPDVPIENVLAMLDEARKYRL